MKVRLLLPGIVVFAAGCMSTGFRGPLRPPPAETLTGHETEVHVTVDERRKEVEIVAGPFPVTTGAPGAEHSHDDDGLLKSPLVTLAWPVEAGLAGVRLGAYTPDGERLSRNLLHHVLGVNVARRQLVYPVPERLFGFGTETPDVRLPGFLEVPLERGDSLGFYAMWNNDTGRDIPEAYLQVVLPYTDERGESALPVYFDTNNQIGGKTSYDLPPGRSTRSYEFDVPIGGGLLAASGHLHDYGVELRLEEAANGRVLMSLRPEVDPDGRVTAVEQRVFRRFFKLIDARVRLEAGARYRVVGVYDNPTGATIHDGGMAHIVGLFVPDDLDAWPRRDASDPEYRADVAALPPPIETAHLHR
jgi:hypothetical protein